ncbi:MAG: recombinase RecT [Dehalococcoidia bacterium]
MAEVKERALAPAVKAQSIRALFNDGRVKSEIMKALPRHMTADKLIRVAMTSIQRSPKLLDCSQQSLLACIMTCAALGLEPDQFLGQAYLVPFWNEKKKCMEAQLIPGYRGYIALARRTGEVQSVSAQVVFQNDHFILKYGLEEILDHSPAEGDRGEVKGAYVIFRYKDGSYSFDYMPKADIDAIRKRSKSADSGPWVTDYGEMAKKTVIKRHAKLAPLSVEFQQAVALEDRANLGETQIDLMSDGPGALLEAETEPPPDLSSQVAEFDKATEDKGMMAKYVEVAAKHFKKSPDEIKAEALKDLPGFMKAYDKWAKGQAQKEALKKEGAKAPVDALTGQELAPGPCPNREDQAIMTVKFCGECKSRKGCPAWPA